jgi:hypothetical protein
VTDTTNVEPSIAAPNGAADDRGSRRLLVALIAGVVVLGALFALALTSYEVVDKQVPPAPDYYEGTLYTIRLFDAFTVEMVPDQRPTFSTLTAFVLTSLGAMALIALLLYRRLADPASRHITWFFVVTWLGFTYLAADETIGFHEFVARNVGVFDRLPLFHKPDDAVFATYSIPVIVFLVVFWRLLTMSRPAITCFLAGGAVFVAAWLADSLSSSSQLDEVLEAIGPLVLAVGFVMLIIDLVAGVLAPTTSLAGASPLPPDELVPSKRPLDLEFGHDVVAKASAR